MGLGREGPCETIVCLVNKVLLSRVEILKVNELSDPKRS